MKQATKAQKIAACQHDSSKRTARGGGSGKAWAIAAVKRESGK